MEQLMRDAFLFLSKNQFLNKAAKKWGLRLGAARFVPGMQISDAIRAVHELNDKEILATLDHLGEYVNSREEAIQSTEACIRTLEAIAENGVRSNLSVKLTQLGVDISRDLVLHNMCRILEAAQKFGNFVRIDMEDYSHNAITLEILKELLRQYDNVGTVIQAYLYKSLQDLEELNLYHLNLRLVKGAYKEPPTVAFPNKDDVDQNFIRLIEKHLLLGNYAAIATHDEKVIEAVKTFTAQHQIPRDRFEFQMLYGIRTSLQEQLAAEGYTMRVYVPYGTDWYGYFMRRLAERPANVGFVLKSLLK